jgi:aerobic-type carbon monoxide dehydrogenase small subunit (CoxS/CutS family)
MEHGTDMRDMPYCMLSTLIHGMPDKTCIAGGHTGSFQEIRNWSNGKLRRCRAYSRIVIATQDAARAIGFVRGG